MAKTMEEVNYESTIVDNDHRELDNAEELGKYKGFIAGMICSYAGARLYRWYRRRKKELEFEEEES